MLLCVWFCHIFSSTSEDGEVPGGLIVKMRPVPCTLLKGDACKVSIEVSLAALGNVVYGVGMLTSELAPELLCPLVAMKMLSIHDQPYQGEVIKAEDPDT